MHIEICGVSKTFLQKGERLQVLDNITFEIKKGEFVCLLGPSGCGKSTLLNSIAGFEGPDLGYIKIDDEPVTAPSSKYVTIFQNYGLLPWRSVLNNVALGLETRKHSRKEREALARKYIDLVGLSKFERSHPHQLSGGMQQRVAIARALAVNPDILFMDEPFGALDAITRIKMQKDILEITREHKKTTLFVTHDIEEAVYLADRIVIMTPNPGRIKEILPVTLPTGRDRTSDDFIRVRDRVFELLNMKENTTLEYEL